MSDLLAKLQAGDAHFSKGQRVIARFIEEHYDKAAFMTAGKLGEAVGVSESTVVRFATELGYDGYPHLQRALQQMVRNKLTAVQRMEVAHDRLGNQDVLRTVLTADVEKIRLTMEEIDRDKFHQAVESLLAAKNIYIIGSRSSSALAMFLSFYLHLIFDGVRRIGSSAGSEVLEQLHRVGKGDVVFGISFPRYSRSTWKAMQFSKDKGATVIALTDSLLSPIGRIADLPLIAKSDMASFVDSLVAPLSVINALIVAIGLRRQDEVTKTFQFLEDIWEEYDVYDKQDD